MSRLRYSTDQRRARATEPLRKGSGNPPSWKSASTPACDRAPTSATLQITTSCVASAPLVTLSPARLIGRPGTEREFTATVTNRDPGMCASSTFDLSGAAPLGFVVTLSSSSLRLAPGAQGNVTFRATPPISSADGDHGLSFGVSDSSAAAHQGAAAATYAVDGTAPSAVTGLTASVGRRSVVNLSWPASSDAGSGVSVHRVLRNGALLTTTTSTSYQDRTATLAGTYDYTVVADDGVGNSSGPGNVVRVTIGSSTTGGGKKK